MTEDISCNELYRIINRALSRWGDFDDVPADREIALFNEKYNYRRTINPQLSIFEDTLPSQDEVKRATQFCKDIETHRESVNIYDDNSLELSEKFYRRLYQNLEYYAPHFSPQNQLKYQSLKQIIQRKLPELQNTVLLDDYNKEIDVITCLHKAQRSETSLRAGIFINQLLNSEDIKAMPPSPKKVTLFEKSLKLVDYLSKESNSRSRKFSLKRDLNLRIRETALNLGPSYKERADLAQYEANRFQKAIDKAQKYGKEPKKRTMSLEERNRRAYDEWLYR